MDTGKVSKIIYDQLAKMMPTGQASNTASKIVKDLQDKEKEWKK